MMLFMSCNIVLEKNKGTLTFVYGIDQVI